jgi:hypothetical protein
MGNNLIWLSYLLESFAGMPMLDTNSESGLLPQTSGALYFLPRQIK